MICPWAVNPPSFADGLALQLLHLSLKKTHPVFQLLTPALGGTGASPRAINGCAHAAGYMKTPNLWSVDPSAIAHELSIHPRAAGCHEGPLSHAQRVAAPDQLPDAGQKELYFICPGPVELGSVLALAASFGHACLHLFRKAA